MPSALPGKHTTKYCSASKQQTLKVSSTTVGRHISSAAMTSLQRLQVTQNIAMLAELASVAHCVHFLHLILQVGQFSQVKPQETTVCTNYQASAAVHTQHIPANQNLTCKTLVYTLPILNLSFIFKILAGIINRYV